MHSLLPLTVVMAMLVAIHFDKIRRHARIKI